MCLFARFCLVLLVPMLLPMSAGAQDNSFPDALRPENIAPGAEMALLSPDGSRIAILEEDGSTELCVREVETGGETCGDIGMDSKSLQGIEWSPDGTALAFTSEPLITGLDPDIWHMDALTGDVANLTDDGVDVIAEGPMDAWPGWTPDGDIIFQRYDRDGEDVRVSLMRISPQGGEPEEVVHFPGEYATLMSGPAFMLDDGSIVLATMPATGFTTGVFRVGQDGAFEHLADDSAVPGQESLVVLDVTADGSTALVYGRPSFEIRFFGGGIALMDLESGEVIQPDGLSGEPLVPATFSTDDGYVLSVAAGSDGTPPLTITGVETGESREIPLIDIDPDDDGATWPHLSLVWAENDTVLLHTGTPTSVLIKLTTP